MLCFVELPKAERLKEPEALASWIELIKLDGKEGKMAETTVERLAKENPEIAKAHEAFKHFSADEMLRDELEAHQKYLRDSELLGQRRYEKGLAKGLAEGRTEGARAKALETARKLKARGLPLVEIADITDLSPAEIQNL
jgi:predicted transposase/invertase (TIGR01784 family)